MNNKEKNYSVISDAFSDLGSKESFNIKGKYFIGQELGLTGCEVSMNIIPAEMCFPFIHAHKMNEELYIIINGKGVFCVDGEEFPIQKGSLIRVAPAGERTLKAGEEDLFYICIQSMNNSLVQSTRNDGFIIHDRTK